MSWSRVLQDKKKDIEQSRLAYRLLWLCRLGLTLLSMVGILAVPIFLWLLFSDATAKYTGYWHDLPGWIQAFGLMFVIALSAVSVGWFVLSIVVGKLVIDAKKQALKEEEARLLSMQEEIDENPDLALAEHALSLVDQEEEEAPPGALSVFQKTNQEGEPTTEGTPGPPVKTFTWGRLCADVGDGPLLHLGWIFLFLVIGMGGFWVAIVLTEAILEHYGWTEDPILPTVIGVMSLFGCFFLVSLVARLIAPFSDAESE